MRTAIGATLAAAICLGMANRAQAAEGGAMLALGARLGFGLPLGSSSGASGDDFNKLFSNMIPLWFELGARVTPHVYVGAYFTYGFGSVATQLHDMGCGSSGVSCDIHDTRFGADFHYHANPDAHFDPWMGMGFGYEWVGFSVSSGNASAGAGFSGWEFFNVQVGLDYRGTTHFGIGPFAAITFAEFENASLDAGAMSRSGSVSNTALHAWLILGLRANFDVVPGPSKPRSPPDSTPDSTPGSKPRSSWDS